MGAEGFTVKGRVVLKRPTSVAEGFGWFSSETVGRTEHVRHLLHAHFGPQAHLVDCLTTRAWTLPFSRNIGLRIKKKFLPKPAAMRVHISYRSRFRISLSIPSTIGQISLPISSFNPLTRDVQKGHSPADLL